MGGFRVTLLEGQLYEICFGMQQIKEKVKQLSDN
jgi:hypothetical protein